MFMGNKNFLVCGVKELDSKYYYLFNPDKTVVYSEKALKTEITKNNLCLLNGRVQGSQNKSNIVVSEINLPLTVSITEREAFYQELVEDLLSIGPFNGDIPFKVLYKIKEILNRLVEQKVMFDIDKEFIYELLKILKSYFNYLDLEGSSYKYRKCKYTYGLCFEDNKNSRYGLSLGEPNTHLGVYNHSFSIMEQVDEEFYEDSVFNKWYKGEDSKEAADLFEYSCFIKYIELYLSKSFSKENINKMIASVDVLIYLLKNIKYTIIGEYLFCGFALNLSDVLSDFFNKERVNYKQDKNTIYYSKKRPEINLVGNEQNKSSRKVLLDSLIDKHTKDIEKRTQKIAEHGKKLNKVMKKYRNSAETVIDVFYKKEKEKDMSSNLNQVYKHISDLYIKIDNSVKELPEKEILGLSDILGYCNLLLKDLIGLGSIGFELSDLSDFSFDGIKEIGTDIKENKLNAVKNLYKEQLDRAMHDSLSEESKEIVKKFHLITDGEKGTLFYCLDKHRYLKARLSYYQAVPYSSVEIRPLLFNTIKYGECSVIENSWLCAYYWMYERLKLSYITKMYASDFYVYFFKKTLATQKCDSNIKERLEYFERHLYGSKEFGWQRDKSFSEKIDVSQYISKGSN